jgi:hypothetical protein
VAVEHSVASVAAERAASVAAERAVLAAADAGDDNLAAISILPPADRNSTGLPAKCCRYYFNCATVPYL